MREFIRLIEGFHFYKNCVAHNDSDVRFLEEMIENAQGVTYQELVRAVGVEEVKRVFPQYDWGRDKSHGLKLKDDWAVSYHKSMYGGYPCYYIQHSRIEYVFVPANFIAPADSGYEVAGYYDDYIFITDEDIDED
jgi:hypothetical protein